MDATLNITGISHDQVINIPFIQKPYPFKGFCIWEDRVVAVSEVEPTEQQKDEAIAWLKALPSEPTQGLLIARFDFKILWGSVWAKDLSDVAKIELPPYQPTIEALWSYPNRSAVYPYMQALVSAGKGTASDLELIVVSFSEQGIDITTIE